MTGIITLTCRGANLYLLDCLGGRLLVDAGWPNSLPDLKRQLDLRGIKLSALRWLMITHAHPDHAGLVQPLKNMTGARLLLHQNQVPALAELAVFFARKPEMGFEPVQIEKEDRVVGHDSRSVLAEIGIQGEILQTPGHSADSISLLLDDGSVFTGDLTRPDMAVEDTLPAVLESWNLLLSRGARTVYPGHGGPASIEDIKKYFP